MELTAIDVLVIVGLTTLATHGVDALLFRWRAAKRAEAVAKRVDRTTTGASGNGPLVRGKPSTRFRVVYYKEPRAIGHVVHSDNEGARARRFFEQFAVKGDELVEFWDGEHFRGRKTADSR